MKKEKKIKEWLNGILMVEYKEDRKSKLKLQDITKLMEDSPKT